MLNLSEVKEGSHCSVVWLIGRIGKMISINPGIALDDDLGMIANYHKNGVIVSHGSRRYAMDYSAAYAVKVELVN